MRIRTLAVAALAAAAIVPNPAGAEEYDCSAAAGKAEHPHVNDPANDQFSAIDGRGQPTNGAMADVHRAGFDVLDAWVSNAGPSVPLAKRYTANIQVAELTETALANRYQQVGARYRFLWTQEIGDPARQERFVEASISQSGTVAGNYGYYGVDETSGLNQSNDLGSTAVTITPGTPGLISIALPFHNPAVGLPPVMYNVGPQSSFDTVAFIWYTDEGQDNGPCFEITT